MLARVRMQITLARNARDFAGGDASARYYRYHRLLSVLTGLAVYRRWRCLPAGTSAVYRHAAVRDYAPLYFIFAAATWVEVGMSASRLREADDGEASHSKIEISSPHFASAQLRGVGDDR